MLCEPWVYVGHPWGVDIFLGPCSAENYHKAIAFGNWLSDIAGVIITFM